MREALYPQQCAVGVESGQQLLTVFLRDVLHRNPDFICVKVDVSNAFNACSRLAMLEAIKRTEGLEDLLPLYAATLTVALSSGCVTTPAS